MLEAEEIGPDNGFVREEEFFFCHPLDCISKLTMARLKEKHRAEALAAPDRNRCPPRYRHRYTERKREREKMDSLWPAKPPPQAAAMSRGVRTKRSICSQQRGGRTCIFSCSCRRERRSSLDSSLKLVRKMSHLHKSDIRGGKVKTLERGIAMPGISFSPGL